MSQLSHARSPEVNQLLASLPRAEYEALLPDLHDVQIKHRQWLSRPNESIEHVYFPRGAVISMLVPMADGQSVEGATIGLEESACEDYRLTREIYERMYRSSLEHTSRLRPVQ